MPNPLTDELSDDAKAELAAVFADLKRRLNPPKVVRDNRPAWLRGMDRRGW